MKLRQVVIEGEAMGAGFDRTNPRCIHIWNCQTTKRNTIKNQLSLKEHSCTFTKGISEKVIGVGSPKCSAKAHACFWDFWKLKQELKSHGLGTLQVCVNWLKVCHEKWFGDSRQRALHMKSFMLERSSVDQSQPTLIRMLKPGSTSFGTTRPRERGALLLTLKFLSV